MSNTNPDLPLTTLEHTSISQADFLRVSLPSLGRQLMLLPAVLLRQCPQLGLPSIPSSLVFAFLPQGQTHLSSVSCPRQCLSFMTAAFLVYKSDILELELFSAIYT